MNKKKFNRTVWMRYRPSILLLAVMLVFSSAKMETGAKAFIQQNNIPEAANVFQQTQQEKSLADTVVNFAMMDILPKFPGGGDAAFSKYLGETIKYPAVAKENNIEGRVIVSFIVEKDGALTGIKVLRDIGGGCGREAIRVLKKSPKWIPGMQNGKAARVAYTCPITFNLPKKQM